MLAVAGPAQVLPRQGSAGGGRPRGRRRASCVGLLGPNGAGKSTLTKIACGLVRPSGGGVEVLGRPAGSPPARAAIGYLAELFRFPGWCSADELLRVAPAALRLERRRRRARRAARAGRAQPRRRQAGGDDVEGDAAAARRSPRRWSASPRLLLLDEPTSALDPVGRRIVRGLLEELRRRDVAVLLNSHLLSEVELVCDRVAIIADGRLVRRGARPTWSARAGSRSRPRTGSALFEGAGREEAPEIVARAGRRGRARLPGRGAASSTLEDVYLEAVGRADGLNAIAAALGQRP